jgi:hypothetical protein
VNADTDANRLFLVGLRCSADRKTAADGAAHGVEDDVEAVTLGLDLRAAEARDLLSGERAVPRQELRRRGGPALLHEVRVATEVREQEAAGDRALSVDRHDGDRSPIVGLW